MSCSILYALVTINLHGLQHVKKCSIAKWSFLLEPPYHANNNVQYYVKLATSHTVCPLPGSIIFKVEEVYYGCRQQSGDATHISLWWKDCGYPHCASQLIISHVPQVINSGESGENGNSELIKDWVLQRFWHFRQFLSIWSWEGTWWVSLIPSKRKDNLHRGGWVKSKLVWN